MKKGKVSAKRSEESQTTWSVKTQMLFLSSAKAHFTELPKREKKDKVENRNHHYDNNFFKDHKAQNNSLISPTLFDVLLTL